MTPRSSYANSPVERSIGAGSCPHASGPLHRAHLTLASMDESILGSTIPDAVRLAAKAWHCHHGATPQAGDFGHAPMYGDDHRSGGISGPAAVLAFRMNLTITTPATTIKMPTRHQAKRWPIGVGPSISTPKAAINVVTMPAHTSDPARSHASNRRRPRTAFEPLISFAPNTNPPEETFAGAILLSQNALDYQLGLPPSVGLSILVRMIMATVILNCSRGPLRPAEGRTIQLPTDSYLSMRCLQAIYLRSPRLAFPSRQHSDVAQKA